MNAKSDAIVFLQSAISQYGEQIDALQRAVGENAANLVERTRIRMQQDQIRALIEDAAQLLSQLTG